ncbi:MAG: hypothetical protein KDJ37_02840 [Hyphomicrobiaceae bacterium]|nr:hypothetical protein [Hyphomicrobiaceae bacterium]
MIETSRFIFGKGQDAPDTRFEWSKPLAGRRLGQNQGISPRSRLTARLPALLAALATLVPVATQSASALDVLPDERAGRQACERRLCEMILDRKPTGPALACDMTKTWDRNKIKKGGASKSISWGFGDARCKIAFKLERAALLPALEQPKYTLAIPPQTIKCEIEGADEKVKPLTVLAAPKIKFKGGRADKVWLNVKDVKGDGMMKGLVWTVAKLADSFGIFHKDTVREINRFVHEKCEAEFGATAAKPTKPTSKGKPKT